MQACVGAGCVVRHVSRDVATRFGQGRLYLSSWQYVEARSALAEVSFSEQVQTSGWSSLFE